MKYTLLVVAILFATCISTSAQEKLADTQEKIHKTVLDVFHSIATRDTTALKTYCSADLLLLENGEIWNLDTLISRVQQNNAPDFKRINTIDFIDTKINGNVAWTTYNNQAEITKNGRHVFIKWLETAILTREDKNWRLKVCHSTLLKRI